MGRDRVQFDVTPEVQVFENGSFTDDESRSSRESFVSVKTEVIDVMSMITYCEDKGENSSNDSADEILNEEQTSQNTKENEDISRLDTKTVPTEEEYEDKMSNNRM